MATIFEHEQLFLFKPAMLPGESTTGYIARVSVFAAKKGTAMTQKLQNKPGYKLAWLFPSGLGPLSRLYGSAMPDDETLLMNHTLFPLFQPFLSREDATALRTHLLATPVRNITAICGLAGGGISSRFKLGMCNACVTEDSGRHAPYWRAAHIFPGLALCPFHMEPLRTFCGKCITGFRRSQTVWIPRSVCFCGDDLVPVRTFETPESQAIEERISRMVQQVLVERQLALIEPATILATIARQAIRIGINAPGGLMKIATAVKGYIGEQTLSAYRLTTGPRSRFHTSLKGQALSRNPIHNLVVILALFGNLRTFIDAVAGKTSAPELSHLWTIYSKPTRRRKRKAWILQFENKSASEIKQMRDRFRNELMLLKKEKSCLKRRDLKPAGLRDAYSFLLRFDRCWLDEILPSRPFRTNESFNDRRRSDTDQGMADHIRMRYNQLVSGRMAARISHARLLQNHSFEGVSKAKFARYPKTVDALEACIESIDSWRARETRLLIEDVMSLAPNWPFGAVLDPDNLTAGKRDYLNRKIRKWLSKKAST